METSTMSDLELRLLHCEREPSVEALSSTADEYLAVGDVEMYEGLRYMAETSRFPWNSRWTEKYGWFVAPNDWISNYIPKKDWNCTLKNTFYSPDECGGRKPMFYNSFADIVRWLGKRLIELDMV